MHVMLPDDSALSTAGRLLTALPLLPGFSGVLCPFPFSSFMHLFCRHPTP